MSNFRLGLYATGDYHVNCCKCKKNFFGDKRALHCLSCTIKHYEKLEQELKEGGGEK